LKQYVEGLSGEHARRSACRSSESAIAAEVLMNNVGQGAYVGIVRHGERTISYVLEQLSRE